MDRLLYKCTDESCGNTVLVITGDPQEVNELRCDCTKEMELEQIEND